MGAFLFVAFFPSFFGILKAGWWEALCVLSRLSSSRVHMSFPLLEAMVIRVTATAFRICFMGRLVLFSIKPCLSVPYMTNV